ncbi:MAG: hypothetical protein J5725_11945 [Bacteroidales bacterium]|nr:hypothetical protein [Bacteroidales bacterium]
MAEKIRVNVEKIELEVNDNGDTIILPVSDERFIQRLYDFSKNVQQKAEEIGYIDKNNIEALVDADIALHEYIKDEFKGLFGDGSYEKVFGEDIVVGAEYVLEFINQCTPFIQNYLEKRNKKLSKYSADRTGSSL